VSNVVDFGMEVDAAVAAPRIHHQHLPDSVRIEAEAITKDIRDRRNHGRKPGDRQRLHSMHKYETVFRN